jgi:phosphopantothenoylcysteine decarboxylase / phosphopantothenate---cysteine ligase
LPAPSTARVLLAVGGGVAAIKAPSMARRLREAGFDVEVAATRSALEFITETSLAVATGRPVHTDASWWAPSGRVEHIELARWADLVVVAPATADLIATTAQGAAPDLVGATLIAGVRRVLWVPAMNTAMWEHPGVRANVARLESWGHRFAGPATGALASAGEGAGIGRMIEDHEVVLAARAALGPADLAGRRVLVTAGPTREYADPVRFLSNPSSGRQGIALAEACRDRGAQVVLALGPVETPPPGGMRVVRFGSALELQAVLDREFEACDLLLMVAAVADYRPAAPAEQKERKSDAARTLELLPNPDLLAGLAPRKGRRVTVGFAMETDGDVNRAVEKARRKQLDLICLNYPAGEATPFGGDTNRVTLVRPDGSAEELPLASKREVADRIVDRLVALLAARPA